MVRRDAGPLTPGLVAVLAAAGAGLCGLLMAVRPAAGIGLALMLFFIPVVMLDLPTGLALWTPVPFVAALPGVWIGPTVASLLVLGAWVGLARERRARHDVGLRRHRAVAAALALLVLWLTLTIGWSEVLPTAFDGLLGWYAAALVLVVFATTLRSARAVRLVAFAFVGGAVLSVVAGLAGGGLHPAESAIESAARLTGGSGDPNYLASGLVAGIALAGGLLPLARPPARFLLLVAMGVLAIGLAATQSRGGLLAACVAGVASVVLLRRHRAQVLLGIGLVASLAAFWLVSTPGALHRVTSTDGGGTGRTELWTVAWRVAESQPLVGVGLGDFQHDAMQFVRRPGELRWVPLLVDQPHVAHNSYLQTLSETGIVGLALLLAVLGGVLALTYRAGARLDAAGDHGLATLARSVLVAQLASLTALVFVSNATDQRLWVLLGVGLALDAIAARRRA